MAPFSDHEMNVSNIRCFILKVDCVSDHCAIILTVKHF